jgi:hypothetical protein
MPAPDSPEARRHELRAQILGWLASGELLTADLRALLAHADAVMAETPEAPYYTDETGSVEYRSGVHEPTPGPQWVQPHVFYGLNPDV